MKKLLLLLLFIPLVSFGQLFDCKVSDGFILVNKDWVDKTSFYDDAKKTTNWSDENIRSIINQLVTNDNTFYIDINNFDNIVVILKSKVEPSNSILKTLESGILKNAKEWGMEILVWETGLKLYNNKHKYIYIVNKSRIKKINLDNWSNQYIISINNKTYWMTINSVNGLTIEDVFLEIT
jgi:hypothetical protein